MDAYDRRMNLEEKILADIIAIYDGVRELFRSPKCGWEFTFFV
jgi:hypothetical protein